MEETVTTDKLKNPGRQEWGRKLGKMSKELKLKKQVMEEPVKSGFHIEYILGIAGVLIGLAALYYQKKSYESVVVVEQQNVESPKREIQLSDF